MKIYQTTQLAAVIASLAGALPAGAATVASGDLILGVRANGGTGAGISYVVSLGQASQYMVALATPITIGDIGSTIYRGNLGQDLTDIYGAGWAARTDLQWGIAGGTSGNNLFVSEAQSNSITIPLPWQINTQSGRNLAFSDIQSIGGIGIVGGLDDAAATANSAYAAAETNSYQNNWRGYMAPGGTPGQAGSTGAVDLYSFASPGIEGTTAQALALFNITGSSASTYVGSFSLGSDGTIAFVPEPSSALLAAASVLPLFFRRRRIA
ncbi:MAG: hypothetical protein WCK77_06610 [Verrucomicrobiota bacterium]